MIRTRNSNLLGKITVLVVICCCCFSAEGKYGGGSGTPEDPYQIWDANHLQSIGADVNDWDKCFRLMVDIDLSGYTGTQFKSIDQFTGQFDGAGHRIMRLTLEGRSFAGLFGYLGNGGVIRNLGLEDIHVSGDSFVGGLVGFNDGSIVQCYCTGVVSGHYHVGGLVGLQDRTSSIRDSYSETLVIGLWYTGGLVGENWGGLILKSYSAGSILGWSWAGGLIGHNNLGLVAECHSSSTVTGQDYVGGLAGSNSSYISECYSCGSVDGSFCVGGLVGWNYGENSSIRNSYSTGTVYGSYQYVGGLVGNNGSYIRDCYSAGSVSSETPYVGGLVGDGTYNSQTENSYWDTDTSGQLASYGGKGKTTSQMRRQSTFQNWDFINTWNIGENQTCPYLRVCLPSDINKDGIVNFLDLSITANQWMEGDITDE